MSVAAGAIVEGTRTQRRQAAKLLRTAVPRSAHAEFAPSISRRDPYEALEEQTSGLRVQACGDAHVSNFGEFATPERNVVFDVSDFDETLPGPWEWDLKRLAGSLTLAGRERGFSAKACARIVRTAVREYREQMAGDVAKARRKTSRRAVAKLTEVVDGRRAPSCADRRVGPEAGTPDEAGAAPERGS